MLYEVKSETSGPRETIAAMPTQFNCAVCNIDMTRAVMQAMRSSSTSFEIREMGGLISPPQPPSVTLTCPNGHTCTYTAQSSG